MAYNSTIGRSADNLHPHDVMTLVYFSIALSGRLPDLTRENIGQLHSSARLQTPTKFRERWMKDQASQFTTSGLHSTAVMVSAFEALLAASLEDLSFPTLQDALGIAAAAVSELAQQRQLLRMQVPPSD